METTISPQNVTNKTQSITELETTIWYVLDIFLMCAILAGNIMTLSAIRISKKLSVLVSNQFIFNLALSDLMVGITLPYHLTFYLDNETFGRNENTCILRFVLIILACSSSIVNLLAIATDRYIAIVHPLKYARYVTRKVAYIILAATWIMCFGIASVPIYWHDWQDHQECTIDVLKRDYVNFIVTPMFASIWIALYLVYFRIWREASSHVKRLRQVAFYQNDPFSSDSKSVQVVLLILGCFSLCWLPYFIIVTYIRLEPNFEHSTLVYECGFTMAAMNSFMNPVIYAWKNTNFRQAFWRLLRCRPINGQEQNFITNHVPSAKQTSITNGSARNCSKVSDGCKTDIELHCTNGADVQSDIK